MTDKGEDLTQMDETTYVASSRTKYILVAVAVVLAFFAAYGIASGRSATTAQASSQGVQSGAVGECDPAAAKACPSAGAGASDSALAAEAGGGGCCDTGSSEPIEGAAVLEGDIQRILVDVSSGSFDPNIIKVQAGVPVEITFTEGSGCMAEVMFKDFAVFQSLTNGGATIAFPSLEAGEYGFSCGMEMVFGTIVAE